MFAMLEVSQTIVTHEPVCTTVDQVDTDVRSLSLPSRGRVCPYHSETGSDRKLISHGQV